MRLRFDEELLRLARRAGCAGVFIGFESISDEGLLEVHKKYNIQKDRDFRASVRRIQTHKISVAGSFIMGLDVDRPGVGLRIAGTANRYGVDILNAMVLTPLPGTDLWKKMEAEGRIASDRFPEDWKYYTLTIPVGRHQHLSRDEIIDEMNSCYRRFYSLRGILRRLGRNLWKTQHPILVLAGNFSYRSNDRLSRNVCHEFQSACDRRQPAGLLPAAGDNLHALAPRPGVHESHRRFLDVG